MSTHYMPLKAIPFAQLFDGRLERHLILEKLTEWTADDERYLESSNGTLVAYRSEDGGSTFSRYAWSGSTSAIVDAIAEEFDTEIVSNQDHRYWGFATEEEMNARHDEISHESNEESLAKGDIWGVVPVAAQTVPFGIRRSVEEHRNQPRYEMLEDGECRPQEIEIGPITWGRERGDEKAFYALHRCGWDPQRIRSELTIALAHRGNAFVRGLLRDLVLQARSECAPQDAGEINVETFRKELRMFSGCPFVRLKARLVAKARFVQEMLAPIPSTEDRLDRRWLDPVPNWLALEVATQTLAKPREFLLWDPSGVSFFSVISADGSRRSGTFALLDRGDYVEVYTLGGGAEWYGGSAAQPDYTVEVSEDGCLMMPTSPNPIYSILPRGGSLEILWEDYGYDLYESYFGRVDRIQYDPIWSPAWAAAVEDRLCDMAAEANGHDDAHDWEP